MINPIPCPVCQTKIPVKIEELMQGIQFACPTCSSSIGIAPKSMPVVKDTMCKLDEIKKKSLADRAKY